jgi:hypothetical protein
MGTWNLATVDPQDIVKQYIQVVRHLIEQAEEEEGIILRKPDDDNIEEAFNDRISAVDYVGDLEEADEDLEEEGEDEVETEEQ